MQLVGCDNCFQVGTLNFADMKEDLNLMLEYTYDAIEAALADIDAETTHVEAEKRRILEERRLAGENDGDNSGSGPHLR